jgi:hypothetical protein
MDEEAQCQGLAKTAGRGFKSPRGAMLDPDPFRTQQTAPEWVEEKSRGNSFIKEVINSIGSGGHKLSASARRKNPSSSS